MCAAKGHVRFTPKADMCGALAYVCFGPKADIDPPASAGLNLQPWWLTRCKPSSGDYCPLSEKSPTGSTLTAWSPAIKTRELIKICPGLASSQRRDATLDTVPMAAESKPPPKPMVASVANPSAI